LLFIDFGVFCGLFELYLTTGLVEAHCLVDTNVIRTLKKWARGFCIFEVCRELGQCVAVGVYVKWLVYR
jgi:hypothetical protein